MLSICFLPCSFADSACLRGFADIGVVARLASQPESARMLLAWRTHVCPNCVLNFWVCQACRRSEQKKSPGRAYLLASNSYLTTCTD